MGGTKNENGGRKNKMRDITGVLFLLNKNKIQLQRRRGNVPTGNSPDGEMSRRGIRDGEFATGNSRRGNGVHCPMHSYYINHALPSTTESVEMDKEKERKWVKLLILAFLLLLAQKVELY
jgi:hypothetical protein